MASSRATGARPGRWVRALAPSVVTRVVTVVGAVMSWGLGLVVVGTSAVGSDAPYVGFALGAAGFHVLAGLLFRTAATQGVWMRADGSVRLCSPFGELVLASGSIDKIRLDRGLGSIFVWSGARIWWLETTSRLGVARPGAERMEVAIAALSETVVPDVGVLESLSDTFATGRVFGLEFSFRGFGRVMRSPAMWVPVLVGQILLAPLAG